MYAIRSYYGLLLAYGANLGTSDALYKSNATGKAITTGLLPNVMNHARVSPHLALNVSKIRLMAEYEMTSANYGVGTIDFSDGLYRNNFV